MIRSVTLRYRFALVPIQEASDPVPPARFVDQAEERQEDNGEDERDRSESRRSDVGDAAGHLSRPVGDVARVLPQRFERVAPPVDETAEIAVPGPVDDLW